MINFLVQAQIDSECDDLVAAALPRLQKYHLADENSDPEADLSGEERLEHIMACVGEKAAEEALIFDAECIEDEGDYARLAREIFIFSGVKNKPDKMKSAYSHEKERAGLAMLIDGTHEKKSWKQSDDWVAQEFIDFMDRILQEYFNKSILSLPAEDQCMRLIIVDAEDYAPLSELLKFNARGLNPRDLYSARLVSTLFMAGTGFILFTLLGWYFLGFWWSLLASFGVWAITAIVLILKYAWICAEEEEAEALIRENPESYGQSIMNAFVAEAAKREGNSEMGRRIKKLDEMNKART